MSVHASNPVFLRSALETLADQIRTFCEQGHERVRSSVPRLRQTEAVRFVGHAVMLMGELETLIGLARRTGQPAGFNTEQMEGRLEALREQVERLAMSELAVQN